MTGAGQPSAGGGLPPVKISSKAKRRKPRKAALEAGVVKQQMEVTPNGGVTVINAKAGAVTLFDKLKAYYHTIITVLAALVVLANEAAPALHMIPGYDAHVAGYVSAGVVLVAALLNALKKNEVWVEK